MKKFVIVWSIVVACAILMGIVACASAEQYPQTFVVDLVNHEQNYDTEDEVDVQLKRMLELIQKGFISVYEEMKRRI